MGQINIKRAGRIVAFLRRPENAGISNREAGRRLGISYSVVMYARHAYKWGEEMRLNISRIRRDGGLQPRAEIDTDTVAEYAEQMEAGVVFPPVTVFYDGTSYWLADGYHRVAAAESARIKTVEVEVKQGIKRDALLFAASANASHGLRRTNADKKRAVLSLLNDAEWSQWTDADVARKCGVSNKTVARYRPESHYGNSIVTERKTVNKHGQESTINTANIGAKKAETVDHREAPKSKPQTRVVEPQPPDFTDEDLNQEGPPEEDDEPSNILADIAESVEARGRSIVNGVEQDDPPDIADQRRRGVIAGVPVITINDPLPPPEPYREPGEQEPETFDEFLGTLPLYRRLSGKPSTLFVSAAKLYYRLQPHREEFRGHAAECLKGLNHDNELAYHLKSWLRVGHPRDWTVCPPTREDGCDGLGTLPGFVDPCPLCRGRGFRCRRPS